MICTKLHILNNINILTPYTVVRFMKLLYMLTNPDGEFVMGRYHFKKPSMADNSNLVSMPVARKVLCDTHTHTHKHTHIHTLHTHRHTLHTHRHTPHG